MPGIVWANPRGITLLGSHGRDESYLSPSRIITRGMQLTQNLARRKHVSKTSRRDLLKVAGVGSLAAGLGINDIPIPKSTAGKAGDKDKDKDEHKHDKVDGPLATAIVSFGSWPTTPPLDRHPDKVSGPPLPGFVPNTHTMIPYEVTIKAGGSVNFIIAGFHQLLVYGDGVEKADINPLLLVVGSNPPGLIDDPNKRIYRGLDPRNPPSGPGRSS